MTSPLEHFEIGYDRHYIGTALHCLLCPTDDNTIREDLHTEIDNGDRMTLADVVAFAEAHLLDAHAGQYGETFVVRSWGGAHVRTIVGPPATAAELEDAINADEARRLLDPTDPGHPEWRPADLTAPRRHGDDLTALGQPPGESSPVS